MPEGEMTMDWLRLQSQAHEEFSLRVEAVTDWHAPTPDSEWDVARLVSHVIRSQQVVPYLLTGRTRREARSRSAVLGDDLPAEWMRYSRQALDAWDSADLSAIVSLPRERIEAAQYLREQTADVAVHAWDLARATGSSETLDAQLVAAAWTIYEPMKETLEASGLFASPVPVPDDAPLQVRLLALTGRDARTAA